MKKKRFIALVLALTITALSLTSVVAPVAEHKNRVAFVEEMSTRVSDLCNRYDDTSEYENDAIISDRLIVKGDEKIDTYNAVESVSGMGLHILQYADAESAQKALEKITADGFTAEYDMIRSADAVSVSGTYNSNWGYDLIETKEALDYFNLKVNSKIVVGIVDSGVNYNHNWFSGSRINRTYYNNSGTGNADDEYDDNSVNAVYHGTAVASVVANCTPNNVKLACYKLLNRDGATTSSRLEAFYLYLTELSKSERPDVLNMSYGGSSYSEIEDELLKQLYDDGMVLVTSAGNDNRNAINQYPSGLSYVISVSASDRYVNDGIVSTHKAVFSNYGKRADITAPGADILVASSYNGSNDSMTYHSGTSFSSPMVAAGCAIVLMQNKKLTPTEVKSTLQQCATPIDNPDERTYAGAGMLNMYNLIDARKVESVEFSKKTGCFDDEFTLELMCSNNYSDIYYTTDYSFPTKDNGVKYSEPITISVDTRVIAVAIPRINTRQRSYYTSESYVFTKSNEDDFIITDEGVITHYTGTDNAIRIPETINGITPVEIGEKAFTAGKFYDKELGEYRYHTGCVQYVWLNDSITNIYNRYGNDGSFYNSELRYVESSAITSVGGFSYCEFLYEVNMPNVTELEYRAFYSCSSLEKFNFKEKLETIRDNALSLTAVKEADFPNVTTVECCVFTFTPIERVNLPKVRKLLGENFYCCSNLKEINIPLLESMGDKEFFGCTSLTDEITFDKIESVGEYGFAGSYFEGISLPSCKTLGKSAFMEAVAKNISIPLVESIENYTFYNCPNLEEVNLRNVKHFNTSSGNTTFSNCWRLKYLELFESDNMPNIYYDGYIA